MRARHSILSHHTHGHSRARRYIPKMSSGGGDMSISVSMLSMGNLTEELEQTGAIPKQEVPVDPELAHLLLALSSSVPEVAVAPAGNDMTDD